MTMELLLLLDEEDSSCDTARMGRTEHTKKQQQQLQLDLVHARKTPTQHKKSTNRGER